MTASLLLLSGISGAFVAAPAADAADRIVVYVRDDGFSQTTIEATEGDELIFQLDASANLAHSLAWEAGWFEFNFSRPERTWVKYGPLKHGPTIRFYDSSRLPGRGPHPAGPFAGSLTVAKAATAPPPPPPTSSTSTTVATAPTTTVTSAPTTTTSAPTQIRPQVVQDPPPTTTTTAAPAPPTTAASGGAPAPAPDAKKDNKDRDKDKAKGKPVPADTSTTTAPAPPDTAWIDFILAPEALTPTPAVLPDQPAGSSADEAAIDAARAASLLDKPVSDADDSKGLVIALAAIGALLLSGAFWAWFTRSSRYDPA